MRATSRAAPSDVIALDHLFQHRHEVVVELAVDAQRSENTDFDVGAGAEYPLIVNAGSFEVLH
jgi:hypothetical protein